MVIIWLVMVNNNLVGGFNLPTPLKNDGVSEFVSWDFDESFPTEWNIIKFHGSSQHQPDSHYIAITSL